MSEMNQMPANIAANSNTPARTTFADELRIIPAWASAFAICAFVAMQLIFQLIVPTRPHPPSPLTTTLLGLFAGVAVAIFILLVGYVNADSRRRGMNAWLWTVIVFFIPNAFGFIVYFLVRQPMFTTCPHCGSTLQPHFRYCPKCATPRIAVCGHCSTPVQPGDQFCNNCGRMLAEPMK